jgi:biotin carboxyl carrier protein
VEEEGRRRHFRVTIELPGGSASASGGQSEPAPATKPTPTAHGTPIFSPFSGTVEVVAIKVRVGERVSAGQVVAAVEAMKAQHDVHSPSAGRVRSIDVRLGDEVGAGQPILTIEG